MKIDYWNEVLYPDGNVNLSNRGSLTVPIGNTAQRPSTPSNGMVRYNTDTGTLESYSDGVWSIHNYSDVLSVDTIADAKALDLTTPRFASTGFIYIKGHTTVGDGGQGLFRIVTINPGADNNGTILSTVSGIHWLVREFYGSVSVKWFGIFGNGDEGSKLSNLFSTSHNNILFDDGVSYYSSLPIELNSVSNIHVNFNNSNIDVQFIITGNTNKITFDNGRFDTSHTLSNFIRLIAKNNEIINDITIRNCSFNLDNLTAGDTKARAIWGYSVTETSVIQNVVIEHCEIFGGSQTESRVDGIILGWNDGGGTTGYNTDPDGKLINITVRHCHAHDMNGITASAIVIGKPSDLNIVDRANSIFVYGNRLYNIDCTHGPTYPGVVEDHGRAIGINVQGTGVHIWDNYAELIGASLETQIGDVYAIYTKAINAVVHNNTVIDPGRQAGIMIKGAAEGARNNLITNNTVICENYSDAFSCAAGISVAVREGVVVQGNTIESRGTPIHTGTAQTGSTANITLASDASGTDSFYNNMIIKIVSGTGVGQEKPILGYTGATKIAIFDTAWDTIPDNTSVYEIRTTAFNIGIALGLEDYVIHQMYECKVLNNTITRCGTGIGTFQNGSHRPLNLTFANNIFRVCINDLSIFYDDYTPKELLVYGNDSDNTTSTSARTRLVYEGSILATETSTSIMYNPLRNSGLFMRDLTGTEPPWVMSLIQKSLASQVVVTTETVPAAGNQPTITFEVDAADPDNPINFRAIIVSPYDPGET